MDQEKITPTTHRSYDSLMMGLNTGLSLLGGAAVGILVYELLRKKKSQHRESLTPLVDNITVSENGTVSKLMTFGWDDDEVCSWARELSLGPDGRVISEKLVEIEYAPEHILIAESNGEEDTTPVLSTVLLDEYGMAKAFSRRSRSGKEVRWDGTIIGAELKELTSEETTAVFDWVDGNIRTISFNGAVGQRMTYYKSIENHLFPDLNMIALGITSDLPLTHILGTRTRHFLSTLEIVKGEEIYHYAFSYLFDSEDRPMQIHEELVVLDVTGKELSGGPTHRDYDIKYLTK